MFCFSVQLIRFDSIERTHIKSLFIGLRILEMSA
jgi:hypothetical protein